MKRRTQYLVDKKLQFYCVRFVFVYLIMVSAFFGYVLVRMNSYSTDYFVSTTRLVYDQEKALADSELADNLRDILTSRDREFSINIVLSILVLAVGLSLLTVGFTNRIAGPIVRIHDTVRQVLEGDYSVRVALRRGDQLKGLAQDLNALVVKLENEKK